MADKAKKAPAKKPAKKKAAKKAKTTREKVEFGVEALAKHMQLEVPTVRAKLRAHDIEKDGGVYDFGSKSGIEKVAKKIAAEAAA